MEMKRLIFVLVLAGCTGLAGGAFAQYRDDATLFTVNAGTLMGKYVDTGESMSGTIAGMTLERVLSGGKVSVGIALAFAVADDDFKVEGEDPVNFQFSGTPVLLTCKYNLLNGRFAAYAGAGLGIHWSSLKTDAGTTDEVSNGFTGMAFSIPVGISYFLDPDFYIQATYNLSLMTTTPLTDDMHHAFTLGLGFQWGKE
jgi:opacity protein-like surface antigen